ncbi:thioredoxin [Brevibacillus agri]|uniref:Thioredoxin n=1 Tax=Brevibacillus agri TaxID=51101 RepID=A0A3M8B0X0_9BACL|nr:MULTISPECIES: TlpA disulfide reductase family protein [Brevibacillus]ELK41817.1 thiol-disulfide oxidoreductase [Brevibacillus agri BAB-2500]EJL42666.1 thiol-disulfide isomerase-like thioredoxin [Brevibacillus sp. CF112]MBG9565893.1 redoxin [Brevibacillus agri]MBY0052481.1 TlpA family protein disulfide reductase [Brevibacillus agri]MCG5254562.1 TlpA family protein disulfide reductase [Brevibacillus agri]
MKKLLLAVLVIAGAGIAVWEKPESSASVVADVQKPEVGYMAPHFTLTGLDNQTYKVEGKRNKPLLLNFWASWCGPCRMEAPDLQKIYEKYGGQIDMYGVNVTSSDNPEAAQAFVQTYKLTFPIPMDVSGSVSNRYLVQAFPTTYLIDAQGIIRKKIIGMIDASTLELELRQLQNEKK